MNPNQVSSTRMMLNITTPSDQTVSFSRGEILQGSVQEVRTDGLVMMLLKGRLIEAATEVMVKPGQQLFLRVDDFRDGKTYLKVLSSEGIEKLENANLSANLQKMGIPVKEETILFARKLLQHNLPVIPQNLNEIQKGINILGEANPRNLEIVTLALSRGLPLNQQVLNALLQFTDPGTDISRLLKSLIQTWGLLSRQAEGEVSEAMGRLSSSVLPTAGQGAETDEGSGMQSAGKNKPSGLSSVVGREVLYPVGPRTEGGQTTVAGSNLPLITSETARDMDRVPTQVAIQSDGDETKAVNRPAGERTGSQPAVERPAGMATMQSGSEEKQVSTISRPVAENIGQPQASERSRGTGSLIVGNESLLSGGDKISSLSTGIRSGDILKFLVLIRPLLDVLQIELSNNPTAVRDVLQNLLQSETELVRGLILLQDLIKDGETSFRSPLISELLNQIEGMERELSGQRIFNYISRMPDSNFNYYYFSFPVKINDEYRLCQMRVNHEAGNKLLKEQDNIKFIVSLDTANLGMVLFHVNWNKNKNLTLQGVVETDEVMHYFNKHINQLIKGLNQLDYTVNNLGVRRVKKEEEIDKLRPVVEEVPMQFRPFSIDVTV